MDLHFFRLQKEAYIPKIQLHRFNKYGPGWIWIKDLMLVLLKSINYSATKYKYLTGFTSKRIMDFTNLIKSPV